MEMLVGRGRARCPGIALLIGLGSMMTAGAGAGAQTQDFIPPVSFQGHFECTVKDQGDEDTDDGHTSIRNQWTLDMSRVRLSAGESAGVEADGDLIAYTGRSGDWNGKVKNKTIYTNNLDPECPETRVNTNLKGSGRVTPAPTRPSHGTIVLLLNRRNGKARIYFGSGRVRGNAVTTTCDGSSREAVAGQLESYPWPDEPWDGEGDADGEAVLRRGEIEAVQLNARRRIEQDGDNLPSGIDIRTVSIRGRFNVRSRR